MGIFFVDTTEACDKIEAAINAFARDHHDLERFEQEVLPFMDKLDLPKEDQELLTNRLRTLLQANYIDRAVRLVRAVKGRSLRRWVKPAVSVSIVIISIILRRRAR